MIASEMKSEEYRELKPYWQKRLFPGGHDNTPKQFDIIRFKNGYGKNSAEMDVEWKGCWVGIGRVEWGSDLKSQYVIWLGKILSIKNYTLKQQHD